MFIQYTYHNLDSLNEFLFNGMFHIYTIIYIITYMIIKSANLMALQYLLTAPEEMMEKAANPRRHVKKLFQAPQKARGAASNARKQVMRNPQVQAHNNAQRAGVQQAPAPTAPQRPVGSTHNFDSPAASFSGGTGGNTMNWNMQLGPAFNGGMPQAGPSFRHGMSQVGQGFGEMGSAVVQGGRNAINRGLQAGANAANAVRNGLQTTGNAIANGARTAGNAIVDGVKTTGNAIANGARTAGNAIANGANAVKNGLQTTGNAIANGARTAGTAVMNGGRNALEWAQKNPGLALGGGYVLYDQLTDN